MWRHAQAGLGEAGAHFAPRRSLGRQPCVCVCVWLFVFSRPLIPSSRWLHNLEPVEKDSQPGVRVHDCGASQVCKCTIVPLCYMQQWDTHPMRRREEHPLQHR